MAVDAKACRKAMSGLGATVDIIRTSDVTGWHAMVVSAVCPVTDTSQPHRPALE